MQPQKMVLCKLPQVILAVSLVNINFFKGLNLNKKNYYEKLKLFTKPDVPLESPEWLSTAVIGQLKVKEAEKMKIYHGNREANIADFFKVTKGKDDLLEVEGDMHRIKYWVQMEFRDACK